MNLAHVVKRFAVTLTVTRPSAATTYTDGVRNAPGSSTFSIKGHVQPVPGRELDRLPEGIRDNDARILWTETELRCGPAVEPDTVEVDGDDWQVETVRDWSGAGNFFRCLIRKV